LERASSVEEFVANPVGRIVRGPTHVVWCASGTLMGTIHWGRPDAPAATELIRRLELTIHPALAAGFDALMDARAMETFEASAFSVTFKYVRSRLETWNRRVRHLAIVLPMGRVGAIVSGLLPLLAPRHPLRFFDHMGEALAWLNRPELPAVLEEVASVVEEVRDLAPTLRALREYLDPSLRTATIESAARALHTTPRTLQRELAKVGARFKSELTRARIHRACVLLEHSDEKIDLVAHQVGLSPSQLHLMFRQVMGETPADYRARHRSLTR
jgi:AraC-like DNA-binding protein